MAISLYINNPFLTKSNRITKFNAVDTSNRSSSNKPDSLAAVFHTKYNNNNKTTTNNMIC